MSFIIIYIKCSVSLVGCAHHYVFLIELELAVFQLKEEAVPETFQTMKRQGDYTRMSMSM